LPLGRIGSEGLWEKVIGLEYHQLFEESEELQGHD
jgi:hypothetical protein